jgi:hypothetical protein
MDVLGSGLNQDNDIDGVLSVWMLECMAHSWRLQHKVYAVCQARDLLGEIRPTQMDKAQGQSEYHEWKFLQQHQDSHSRRWRSRVTKKAAQH